ncbi:MAG TPA: TetR/AcrR family transcriptional regulator [Pseudonocardiaceae bacterium]|nr:TetR/AcrR family transcriptional regulator [Pseudonocardiaceae bacterium]
MSGLRERKKLATRQALSWAALRLATERGLENVHVEDIAAAAGVSPRTYNNYFPSKEAAICGIAVDRGERISAELLARPAGEPLAEALLAAVMAQYEQAGEPDREWVARTRLVTSSPALRGEFLKALAVTEQSLADAIARRRGDDGLFPGVLAAMVTGATRVGVDHWFAGDTGESFLTVVAAAVRMALAGI